MHFRKIFILTLFILFAPSTVMAEPVINIVDYPKEVIAGESAQVTLKWNDIPESSKYILIVQLENWDIKPAVFIRRDITSYKTQDEKELTLKIPTGITLNPVKEGFRFVAAFLSREKDWEETLCVTATPKDVSLKSKVNIIGFPAIVFPGEKTKVRVSWHDIPTDAGYILIVQFENWDAKPPIVNYTKISDFKSSGSRTVEVKIPDEAKSSSFISGYRFVAAFISNEKGWEDLFAADATSKIVTIKR